MTVASGADSQVGHGILKIFIRQHPLYPATRPHGFITPDGVGPDIRFQASAWDNTRFGPPEGHIGERVAYRVLARSDPFKPEATRVCAEGHEASLFEDGVESLPSPSAIQIESPSGGGRPSRDAIRRLYLDAAARGPEALRLVLPSLKQVTHDWPSFQGGWETFGDALARLGEVDQALAAYWDCALRTVDSAGIPRDFKTEFVNRCVDYAHTHKREVLASRFESLLTQGRTGAPSPGLSGGGGAGGSLAPRPSYRLTPDRYFDPYSLSIDELRQRLESDSPWFSKGWVVLHEKCKARGNPGDGPEALYALERAAESARGDFAPSLSRRLQVYRQEMLGQPDAGATTIVPMEKPSEVDSAPGTPAADDMPINRLFPEAAVDSTLEDSLGGVVAAARRTGGYSGLAILHSFILGQASMASASAARVKEVVDTLRACAAQVQGYDRAKALNTQAETLRKLGLRRAAGVCFWEMAKSSSEPLARANALASAADEFRLAGDYEQARIALERSLAIRPSEHNRRRLMQLMMGPGPAPFESIPAGPLMGVLEATEDEPPPEEPERDEGDYLNTRAYLKAICDHASILTSYQQNGDYLRPEVALRAFETGEKLRREALEALKMGRNEPALEDAAGHLGTASRIFFELSEKAGERPSGANRCWSTYLATRGTILLQGLFGAIRREQQASTTPATGGVQDRTPRTDVAALADAACDLLAHSIDLNANYEEELTQGRENIIGKQLRMVLLDHYTKAALIGDFWKGDRSLFHLAFLPNMFLPWLSLFRKLTGEEPWFNDLVESLVHHWGYLTTRVRRWAWWKILHNAVAGTVVEKAVRIFVLRHMPAAQAIGAGMRLWEADKRPTTMGLVRVYAVKVLEPAQRQQTELVENALRLLRSGEHDRAVAVLQTLLNEPLWTRAGALAIYRDDVFPVVAQLLRSFGSRMTEDLIPLIFDANSKFGAVATVIRENPMREGYEVVFPLVDEGTRKVKELEGKVRESTTCEIHARVCGAERRNDRVTVAVRLWNEGTATAKDVTLDFSQHRKDMPLVPDPPSVNAFALRTGGSFAGQVHSDVKFELVGLMPETMELMADIGYTEHQQEKTIFDVRIPLSLAGPPPQPLPHSPFDPSQGYTPEMFKGRDREVADCAERILNPSRLTQQHFIIGVPRIGKTWFLHGLADRLIRDSVEVRGERRPVYPLYVSLAFTSSRLLGDPFDLLAQKIVEQKVNLPHNRDRGLDEVRMSFACGLKDVSTWRHLLRLVDEHHLWVVFLLDELQYYFTGKGALDGSDHARNEGTSDAALSGETLADFYGPGFFNALRRQAEEGRGSTVYCGLWEVEHHLATPSVSLPAAAFSTAAAPYYLPPLTIAGCAEVWKTTWLDLDQNAAEYLYDLSGGLPGLLQLLLQRCWAAAGDYGVTRLARGHLAELFDREEFHGHDPSLRSLLVAVFNIEQLLPGPEDAQHKPAARAMQLFLARAREDGRHAGGYVGVGEVSRALQDAGVTMSEESIRDFLGGMVKRYWVDNDGLLYRMRSRLLARQLAHDFRGTAGEERP